MKIMNVTEHDTNIFGHVVEIYYQESDISSFFKTFGGFSLRESILMFIMIFHLDHKSIKIWDTHKMEFIMEWNPDEWELKEIGD